MTDKYNKVVRRIKQFRTFLKFAWLGIQEAWHDAFWEPTDGCPSPELIRETLEARIPDLIANIQKNNALFHRRKESQGRAEA